MVTFNLPSSGVRPCVLIIDDEEIVRVALRAILQSEYNVLEAASANQGIEILKREHPDLVTMDVLMPGQSGLDALRQIRTSDENSNLPVIMITGHASLDSACEALRLGATDYLQKPFGVDELKTSIRNGLLRQDAAGDSSNGKGRATEGEPTQEEENASREKLVRLGKASAAFVHDLASPLQVLAILNSMCFQKLTTGEPSVERDREILDAVQQMERLVSWSTELIKGWQSIAVPSHFAKEQVDVDTLLGRVSELVEPYARLNGVALSRAPLPEKMKVEGDRVQLERALVNISLNGIKASTARGRTLEVSAHPFHHHVVFRVTDSGEGFSPERMKEVLKGDPFASPAKTRRGLGLFIADWIAVNHGGKLQFICEKGQGTTVELFLPT
jgi:DNA-binding response OmpR family regulator